jgi:hypothetical protein
MLEKDPTDKIIDAKAVFVQSLRDDTGYPFNLHEEQIVRMVYFFGSRKFSNKAAKNANSTKVELTGQEKLALKDFFEWFGLRPTNPSEHDSCYRSIIVKFKQTLDFLKRRPAFITRPIYNALTTCGYGNVVKSVVPVVDKYGRVGLRSIGKADDPKKMVPITQMDSLLFEIQNIGLDKIMLIMQSITPSDIKKATLGNKSKAIRDLYSMIHMARQSNKNPNLMLTQININSSDPMEKLKSYGNYITKNRDG